VEGRDGQGSLSILLLHAHALAFGVAIRLDVARFFDTAVDVLSRLRAWVDPVFSGPAEAT
jgi:hypothetical protein